jgi:class 3 adenylate cyclase/tetratricopeptide (TPR) repeat protein
LLRIGVLVASVETVAVLFTDLVGSTELASRVGPERSDELRLEFFGLLRDAIAASRGREVKSLGDGVMAVFPSAAAAIDSAVSMNQRIEMRNRSAADHFVIRVGISMGDASYENGDYYGTPVIEAARLCARARGGQILLSEVTRIMAGSRGAHEFSSLGALALKGLPAPVLTHELSWTPLESTEPDSMQPPRDDLPPLPPTTHLRTPLAVPQPFLRLEDEIQGPVSSERFVGRESELAALRADSGVVLIAGDAGVGKSRLVSEVERRASAEGKLVLVGECFELTEGELPYGPIVAALRPVLHEPELIDSFSSHDRAELSRLWPELAPPDTVVARNGHTSSQDRIFAVLLQLLTRLALQQPLILIVEDLHWADRSTRDFLSFLVRAARGARVLVMATLRDEDVHRDHPVRGFVAELARVRGVRRFQLAPFSRTELSLQVEAILGRRPSADLVEHLFERSEGNAFYTEELLAAGARTELPPSLRDVLLVRIERLSPPARRLLAVAATAGRAVDERLLAAVAGVPDLDFPDALREGLGHQVLVAHGDGTSYGFRHALVREAVYGDLLATERVELHGALARTLVQRPELSPTGIGVAAELAHHWYAAGDTGRALTASVTASAEAERAFAFDETHRHCERALALWHTVPDPARAAGIDRIALLARASAAAIRADDPARAAELARRAAAEIDPALEPLRLARIHVLLGRASWLCADMDGALSAYRTAVKLVPPEPPSSERALVLAGEGQVLMLSGRSAEARERCEEALKLAVAVGDRLVQAQVHNTLAGLGGLAGDSVAHATTAREIATSVDAIEEIGRSYANGSEALEYDGRVEEAIALAQEGIAAAPRWGMRDYIVYLNFNVAGWQLRLGRLAEAERICNEVTPRGHTAAASRHRILGELAAARGELDVARAELERAAELAKGMGGVEWWPAAMAALGLVHLRQGRPDDAAEALDAAVAAVDDLEYKAWLPDFVDVYPIAVRVRADRAEHARSAGSDPAEDVAVAHGAQDALEHMLSADTAGPAPPRAHACAALTAAEVTRAGGQSDPAAWRRAADRLSSLGERYAAAYAEFRLAEALWAAGADVQSTVAPRLASAHATTVQLGERPLRADIEALAGKAGVQPPLGAGDVG